MTKVKVSEAVEMYGDQWCQMSPLEQMHRLSLDYLKHQQERVVLSQRLVGMGLPPLTAPSRFENALLEIIHDYVDDMERDAHYTRSRTSP
jgi:hypothetical protein